MWNAAPVWIRVSGLDWEPRVRDGPMEGFNSRKDLVRFPILQFVFVSTRMSVTWHCSGAYFTPLQFELQMDWLSRVFNSRVLETSSDYSLVLWITRDLSSSDVPMTSWVHPDSVALIWAVSCANKGIHMIKMTLCYVWSFNPSGDLGSQGCPYIRHHFRDTANNVPTNLK